jgi:hypothetical protein
MACNCRHCLHSDAPGIKYPALLRETTQSIQDCTTLFAGLVKLDWYTKNH